MFNVPINQKKLYHSIHIFIPFWIKLYYNRIIHEIIINSTYGITIIKRESRHASWKK